MAASVMATPVARSVVAPGTVARRSKFPDSRRAPMFPLDDLQGRHRRLAPLIVLSLALGIGAMSTVGSIVHAVLLRALPFSAPERLVLIGEADPAISEFWKPSSYFDYLGWKSLSRAFTALAVSRPWNPILRLPADSALL